MFSKTDIEKYFMAEKSESFLFVILGLLAVGVSAYFFFFIKNSFYKGFVIPLTAVAVLQLVVGYTVYKRSDAQRKDLVYKLDMNPAAIQQAELPRMEVVMKNFIIYRWVEITLLLVGLVLIFLYKANVPQAYWCGFGVALALQAAIILGADYFAEQRGSVYVDGLKKILDIQQ